jgi:alpha/beta superfamily hydrolase
MEVKINFSSELFEIEARFEKNSSDKGVITTHPHPLYGGSMHNEVVLAVCRVYQQAGYSTLRFNLRGVGESQGSYSDGAGEQEDVRAAVSYLVEQGIAKIDLVGYSFGAWVNALSVNSSTHVDNMLMISPPVAFIDFESISDLISLKLIITGSRDDIAPAKLIEKSYHKWNPKARFGIIEGADHFYAGYIDELEALLAAHLDSRKDKA